MTDTEQDSESIYDSALCAEFEIKIEQLNEARAFGEFLYNTGFVGESSDKDWLAIAYILWLKAISGSI